jgi:myo-inositol 2-dehydrogenase/D-chiro-inositol 1-dehydrogenase
MKDVNLGFIATGFMGTLYARISQQLPGVNVAALLDIDPDRVLHLADELGAPAYVGVDYSRMLAEHPEIDGVIITTPEDNHLAPALSVIEAGKNILLEKPMTTSTDDAKAILEAVEGKDIISMIAYSLRFDQRYVAAKNAVANGQLGEILNISSRRNIPLGSLKRLNGRVENPFWVGVHDIDMMRWITGSNIKRVMAMATNKGLEDWPIKGSYFALLEFENGVIASLETTWAPSNLMGLAQPYIFKLEGTAGQLMVRAYDSGISVYQENQVSQPDTVYMPKSYDHYTGVYRDQIAYFVRCLREGLQTDIPLKEGLNGVKAAEAIIQSADERREVVLTN